MGSSVIDESGMESGATLRRTPRCAVWLRVPPMLAVAVMAGLSGGAAVAQDEPAKAESEQVEKLDFKFHHPQNPDHWLLPSLRADSAWFTGVNAWGGNTKENLGNKTNGWAEFGLVPALDGQYSLGKNGTLSARLSGVYSTTQLGMDYAGSNFIDGETKKPEDFTLEDAYVRWTSGDLVPSLGKDAIELSAGAQQYAVGSGFLFGNGGSDGGNRGGYWLGLRTASELTGIARLRTGEFFGETVYFRTDDRGGDHTNGVGANAEYDFGKLLDIEQMKLGLGYWNLFNSDNERRDGLNVVNVRLDTIPLEALPGIGLSGEFVKEKNQAQNDSWAITAQLAYDFAADDVPAAPYVSYRFAFFTGDDQNGDNDNRFDPLYYNFNDWNQWYIGEILGEWITGNSNINSHTIRLRANPFESVAVNLFYIYTRLNEKQDSTEGPGGRPVDPRVVAIGDKDLSHEIDFIVDWTVNDYLMMSAVAATLIPESGAKDFFGNDEVWAQFMLNTSIRF